MSSVGQMALVRWVDANFDRDLAPDLAVVESLGWIVAEQPGMVTLAAEKFDDGSHRDFTVIPRACIKKMVPLAADARHTRPVLRGGADLPRGEAP